jgi:hypothetical protein
LQAGNGGAYRREKLNRLGGDRGCAVPSRSKGAVWRTPLNVTSGGRKMMMSPGLRKFALTTHVTSSAGWLGSVAAFLALAIAGISSEDSQVVRAAYLAMHLTTWFVIVPFSFASFLTGLVESLGTPWGLFRHYWVVTKLVLTVLATSILLLHTQPIDRIAEVAAQSILSSVDLRQLRLQLIGDASAALFVLMLTTTLSVYKPWGMTPYGIRSNPR